MLASSTTFQSQSSSSLISQSDSRTGSAARGDESSVLAHARSLADNEAIYEWDCSSLLLSLPASHGASTHARTHRQFLRSVLPFPRRCLGCRLSTSALRKSYVLCSENHRRWCCVILKGSGGQADAPNPENQCRVQGKLFYKAISGLWLIYWRALIADRRCDGLSCRNCLYYIYAILVKRNLY